MAERVRKIDRRIARTQAMLRDALMELVTEIGYDNVTIQDIVDRANVSRTTFYLHYKDKDHLLTRSLIDVYDDLALHEHISASRETVQKHGIPESFYTDIDFQHVQKHAKFYRALLSEKGSSKVLLTILDYLRHMMAEDFLRPLAPKDQPPHIPLDFIAAFLAGGEIGLVRWWLDNDMPFTSQQMARMMFDLSAYGVLWALRVSLPQKPSGADAPAR
ncbi:MAG: TetR/AcrR family transcriptional regulator [Pleurocapsa minor GSE-CHR-MK-17-07R]|jgi:AcrR family transcriptional regulator|nr:TetR/AcrR family transcriptional regulator [Pleurocapsa minor GSE-CHR-MK 17-07R]